MMKGTPLYSNPIDVEGRKPFQVVLHRSAVPPMLGGFMAVDVQTTNDDTDGKRRWVGMESPVNLEVGDAVLVTFVDVKRFVRFLVPEGTDGAGISIRIDSEQ